MKESININDNIFCTKQSLRIVRQLSNYYIIIIYHSLGDGLTGGYDHAYSHHVFVSHP